MPRTTNDIMQRIVEAIKEVGPRNISRISRISGLPTETVRYKIKKQLKEKGITIHLVINYEKLGLKRYWLNLQFIDEGEEIAKNVLEAFAKKGYLTYYARTLPEKIYTVMLALPPKFEKDYKKMLEKLKKMNILKEYKMWRLAWIRYLSMRSKYYDFKSGEWVIDWEELERDFPKVEPVLVEKVEENPRIDKLDLLIIAYLQYDSFLHISKIAELLKVNPKKVRYHYLEHIVKNRVIDRYLISWTTKEERKALCIFHQFRGLNYRTALEIESTFHKLPFTRFDALSEDNDLYLVQMTLPLNYFLDTLRFMSNRKNKRLEKCKSMIADLSFMRSFSIPFEMFDEENREWIFDEKIILEEIRQKCI